MGRRRGIDLVVYANGMPAPARHGDRKLGLSSRWRTSAEANSTTSCFTFDGGAGGHKFPPPPPPPGGGQGVIHQSPGSASVGDVKRHLCLALCFRPASSSRRLERSTAAGEARTATAAFHPISSHHRQSRPVPSAQSLHSGGPSPRRSVPAPPDGAPCASNRSEQHIASLWRGRRQAMRALFCSRGREPGHPVPISKVPASKLVRPARNSLARGSDRTAPAVRAGASSMSRDQLIGGRPWRRTMS